MLACVRMNGNGILRWQRQRERRGRAEDGGVGGGRGVRRRFGASAVFYYSFYVLRQNVCCKCLLTYPMDVTFVRRRNLFLSCCLFAAHASYILSELGHAASTFECCPYALQVVCIPCGKHFCVVAMRGSWCCARVREAWRRESGNTGGSVCTVARCHSSLRFKDIVGLFSSSPGVSVFL